MKGVVMYFVYTLEYDGQLLYVGMGKGKRDDHALSGASHNAYLNKFVAFGYDKDKVVFKRVKSSLTQEEAFTIEKELIQDTKPLFNIKDSVVFSPYERADYWLEQHGINRMFTRLGWVNSTSYIKRFEDEILQLKEYVSNLESKNKALTEQLKGY